MCVCVCLCVCVSVSLCVYVCDPACPCLLVGVSLCLYVCESVCLCLSLSLYVCVCVCVRVCVFFFLPQSCPGFCRFFLGPGWGMCGGQRQSNPTRPGDPQKSRILQELFLTPSPSCQIVCAHLWFSHDSRNLSGIELKKLGPWEVLESLHPDCMALHTLLFKCTRIVSHHLDCAALPLSTQRANDSCIMPA